MNRSERISISTKGFTSFMKGKTVLAFVMRLSVVHSAVNALMNKFYKKIYVSVGGAGI